MPRTIYLSFLGTNAYVPCNYYKAEGARYEQLHFVQEASLRFHQQSLDAVYIFATREAERRNWVDNGQDRPEDKYLGLQSRIAALGLLPITEKVAIPDGFVEAEIWEIFEAVSERVQPGDRLVLDITHALRYQPMLGMVLLNYLQVLKKTEVLDIYYGAFEALGPAYKVREMPLAERNAQVLSLKSFARLQDWTNATDLFVNYGNAQRLLQIGLNNEYEAVARQMHAVMQLFATVRGHSLLQGSQIVELRQQLASLKSSLHAQKSNLPFAHLVASMEAALNDFQRQSMLNGFRAVYFCLEHELVQQAVSLLLESTLSYLLAQMQLSWDDRSTRTVLSACLSVDAQSYHFRLHHSQREKEQKLIDTFYANYTVDAFAPLYQKLGKLRNDMMHAGMNPEALPAPEIVSKTTLYYNQLAELVNLQEGHSALALWGNVTEFYRHERQRYLNIVLRNEAEHGCTLEEYETRIDQLPHPSLAQLDSVALWQEALDQYTHYKILCPDDH